MTWTHAAIAGNLTMICLSFLGMAVYPSFPDNFKDGYSFGAFMAGVWGCAIIGWHTFS